jgi:hypothetical protein
MRISKSVMAVCGVVLAAALIGFTNPKTVHAVAAALVQVTNTASNPVVTQGVGAQAGNMVQLLCEYTVNSSFTGCRYIPPTGNASFGSYTVPAGVSLVLTSVDVTPSASTPSDCFGTIITSIFPSSNSTPTVEYFTSIARITTHFAYPSPSGVVFASGTTPETEGALLNASPDCVNSGAFIHLYGYLTAQ